VIFVTTRIEVPPASRRELLQVLLLSAEGMRREPGALAIHVYEDLESATCLCLESRWSARVALGAHVRSTSFGNLLGAVELLAEGSDVALVEVSEAQENQLITLRALRDTLRRDRSSS
jgi:quinol monooxygenase YgiN